LCHKTGVDFGTEPCDERAADLLRAVRKRADGLVTHVSIGRLYMHGPGDARGGVLARCRVGRSTVKVWRQGGHWAVSVDGLPVGGLHMSEAQAAGAGLLHVMFSSKARGAGAETQVAAVGRHRVR